MDQARGYCRNCKQEVLITKKGTNHILHLLLTICTAGLWLLVWIPTALKPGGWRCSQCGKKVLRQVLR